MTLAEAKKLKRGDVVYYYLGSGWIQRVKFQKVVEYISYGKHTLNDVVNNRIDFSKGTRELAAECLNTDNHSIEHISLRKLHKD